MRAIERLERKLRELKAVINPTLKQTIDRNKGVLIDQQQTQMNKGRDAFNVSFIPSYAESTIKQKKAKGDPFNRVTLKDTGELYRSITIDTTTTQAIISTNVEYFKYLVDHYDTNIILGIQSEFLNEFLNKYFKPELRKAWEQILKR